MTFTNEQRLTLLVVFLITVAVLVWDYVLLRDGVPDNTISSAFKVASSCLPVPMLFGIWMAHSWWYLQGPETHRGTRMLWFLIVVVLSWVWWECSNDPVRSWLSDHPAVTFQTGFVVGHFVWPQYLGIVGG